jgi:hypothetical protein
LTNEKQKNEELQTSLNDSELKLKYLHEESKKKFAGLMDKFQRTEQTLLQNIEELKIKSEEQIKFIEEEKKIVEE